MGRIQLNNREEDYMNSVEKVKALSELYHLVNFYYEHRDHPVESGFDFFENIQVICDDLGVDFSEFKKEFKLDIL